MADLDTLTVITELRSEFNAQIGRLTSALELLDGQTKALATRLAALESRPVPKDMSEEISSSIKDLARRIEYHDEQRKIAGQALNTHGEKLVEAMKLLHSKLDAPAADAKPADDGASHA